LPSRSGRPGVLVRDRSLKPTTLTWQRFTKLTAARCAFSLTPCIYVQRDRSAHPIRVGKATKGLTPRYRGGTGHALDTAMHDSGNLVYVAAVAEPLCDEVERALIWAEREHVVFNNQGKKRPPSSPTEFATRAIHRSGEGSREPQEGHPRRDRELQSPAAREADVLIGYPPPTDR
jgi:hypothetical protein